MTTTLSASIVVPVLNAASTIDDMLKALTDQADAPEDTEVIIIDGGSTDGTQEIVQSFDVRLLEERKRGPAAARNLGLRNARGDIVLHLDADTIPTRRWLSELVAPFRNSNTVLAGGRTLSLFSETPVERFMAALGVFEPRNNIFQKAVPYVPSVNMAVRREPALAIGGWSEDLITAEDIDFCHRLLREYPTQIAYVPTAILLHRNRRTDDELQRLAWTYGEGAAQIYLRYPDLLHWGIVNSLRLAGKIMYHRTLSTVLQAAETLGLTSHEEAELAYYHKFWTLWFWGGFFSMRTNKEHRSPRPEPRART